MQSSVIIPSDNKHCFKSDVFSHRDPFPYLLRKNTKTNSAKLTPSLSQRLTRQAALKTASSCPKLPAPQAKQSYYGKRVVTLRRTNSISSLKLKENNSPKCIDRGNNLKENSKESGPIKCSFQEKMDAPRISSSVRNLPELSSGGGASKGAFLRRVSSQPCLLEKYSQKSCQPNCNKLCGCRRRRSSSLCNHPLASLR